jgi:hypothetical protein
LHSTAITKLASQENSQGHVNGAVVYFLSAAPPLTVFLLAATSCLSDEMAGYVQGV